MNEVDSSCPCGLCGLEDFGCGGFPVILAQDGRDERSQSKLARAPEASGVAWEQWKCHHLSLRAM